MHRNAKRRALRTGGLASLMLLVPMVLGGCGTPESAAGVKAPAVLDARLAAAPPSGPFTPEPVPTSEPKEAYNRLLVRAYRDLAEKAFREMDWVDGYRFNRKAELAARGQKTEPDTPESRSIAVARDPDIRRAYVTLRDYLKPAKFQKAPERIALAQAAYDCWVEDAEESLLEMRQGLCRKQFEDSIRTVETVMIDDALDTIEAPAAPLPSKGKAGL